MTLWNAWPFWLKLILAGALVFLLSSLGTWWVDDRSSFPTWLASIATAAALLAAIVAARYAAGAFQLETDREQRWIAQQRSSQAQLIAAWPGQMVGQYEQKDGLDEEDPLMIVGFDLHLRNASDVPVTRVWVEASVAVNIRSDEPVRIPLVSQQVARILEPRTERGKTYIEAETPADLRRYVSGGVKPDYWCEVSVSFRDGGGRDWERLPDGQLILVQDANAKD